MQPNHAIAATPSTAPELRRRFWPGTGQKPISILYLDSNGGNWLGALGRLADAGLAYEAELVETPEALCAALKSKRFDLVLCAYRAAGLDGPGVLELVRHRSPDLPFIFASAVPGVEEAVEAMRMGATDYVLKQHLERLVPAVIRALRETFEQPQRNRLLRVVDRREEQGAFEENYPFLANALPQFIWVLDEWGNPEFLNQYWFDYTGQSLSDQLNGNWRLALHPDDRAAGEAAWSAARENDREAAFEFRVRRASDGTYRWFSGRSRRLAQGSTVRWAGSAFDITDRKQREAQRERHASQLRNLFESDLFGVIWSDSAGGIHDANDQFLKMTGYSREDLRAGRIRWREMTPPEHLPLDEAGIAECLRRGACTPYEKEYIRKDGSRVPVLIGYTRAEPGEDLHICFVLDLTAREQLVKELARSNEDLSRFAHVVSHDLQAPLRLIRAYTELLGRKLPEAIGAEGREIMRTIAGAVAEMQDLIESLLRYAQIGLEPPENRPLACSEVLDSVAATLRPVLEETGASLECGPLPQVRGNPIQLRQVFQNLLMNALKYRAPSRPPHIRITAQSAGAHVRFAVEDNGIGIQPKHYEQIFQPLKRLHGYDIPGTGMGLAVCKSIVERHGGRIWVESTPGEGSAFYFTLAS